MLGGSWGVREDEERLPFACDRFVTDPGLVAHRGTTVAAAPVGAHKNHLLRAPRAAAGGCTRPLLEVVRGIGPLVARAVCLGDLVMARRQPLSLRALAESSVTGR